MEEEKKTGTVNGEVQLLDYLLVLAKHSRMIILVSAAVIVLTYLMLFIPPNKYTATTRLLPPQQNLTLSAQLLNSLGGGGTPGAFGAGLGGIGGMAAGFLGLRNPSDLYVGLLTGDAISDRVIERFHLRKVYDKKYIEDVRKKLRGFAQISTERKSGLIEIQVTDKDRQRAAAMANAFVKELDKLLQRLAVQEARNRLAFLERERLRVNRNLTKAENTLRTFSEQNNVIQIGTQTKGALEYIARLRAEIDAREVQIGVLSKQATPYNYDVVRLKTEIKGLKDKLATAEKQDDPLEDVCLPTSKVPTLGLEYLRLYREVKFQEALYHLYTQLVEVARLDIARNFPVVQEVDRAQPPEKRSNTRLTPALLAGIATFFTMIFVAFAQEYWQNAQKEAEFQRISFIKNELKPWLDLTLRIKSLLSLKNKT
jgi:tyrosine-protein kinase Etk/Wzc